MSGVREGVAVVCLRQRVWNWMTHQREREKREKRERHLGWEGGGRGGDREVNDICYKSLNYKYVCSGSITGPSSFYVRTLSLLQVD